MKKNNFDCLVIGLGGMGSSALYELQSRGLKTLGLEQFTIPHERGSSHGLSRIIRLAYFEHPSYIPLLKRSYEKWTNLEKYSDQKLFHQTGSIDASRPEDRIFQGSLRSCETFDLDHQILTSSELQKRFPGYELPLDFKAVYQPQGGFLIPETCIETYIKEAKRLGATIKEETKVTSLEKDPQGVRVVTNLGEVFYAKKAVLTAGAWTGQLYSQLKVHLQPVRQVMGWFQTNPEVKFEPDTFPVFNLGLGQDHFYGFPSFKQTGLKIGKWQHLNQWVEPDKVDTTISEQDEDVLRNCLKACFPQGNGALLKAKTCLFTNTPDEHFLIHQDSTLPLVSGSGFSGHGFKFCSVIGEILADLILNGETTHDIRLFSKDRF
jgi:sarcosine oxidase